MSDWLAERWQVLTGIVDRPWIKVAAVIWAVIGAYDLLADQLLPKWIAERLPPVRDVVDTTSGWLPWWAWGWIGTILLAGAVVEYAVRLHQTTKPKRIAQRLDAPPMALSPAQERLLWLVADYQQRFAASKLIVNRAEGTLHFDEAPERGKGVNFIRDLYGSKDVIAAAKFEALVESVPTEYLRMLPEARWDNPFVLSVTEAGIAHIKHQAATELPPPSPDGQ